MKNVTSLIFILITVFLLNCSHQLNITLRASRESNNGGNPVVVRIYQLKNDVNFNRATIESFWSDDKKVLGSDLLGDPIEVVIHPDESKSIEKIKLMKEAKFLGAAADFYSPDKNHWHYIYNLSSHKGADIIIAVGRDRLAIATPE